MKRVHLLAWRGRGAILGGFMCRSARWEEGDDAAAQRVCRHATASGNYSPFQLAHAEVWATVCSMVTVAKRSDISSWGCKSLWVTELG